jgi:Mor family transcriptional regulator
MMGQQGEDRWSAKLTEKQVLEIRARYAAGERIVAIARDYDCSMPNIHHIVKRNKWKHLPPASSNG